MKERSEISDVRIFTHSVRAFRAKVSSLTSQLPSMSEGGLGRVGRLTDPPWTEGPALGQRLEEHLGLEGRLLPLVPWVGGSHS